MKIELVYLISLVISILIILELKREKIEGGIKILLISVIASTLITSIYGIYYVTTNTPKDIIKEEFREEIYEDRKLGNHYVDLSKIETDTVSGITKSIEERKFEDLGGFWWIGRKEIEITKYHLTDEDKRFLEKDMSE